MSFINKFLELTAPLPRRIVRLLYLLKFAEERYYTLNQSLKNQRHQYLKNMKSNHNINNTINLKDLKSLQAELISLSEYKIGIIKEIKYIIKVDFLSKLHPIIKEAKSEIMEKSSSSKKNKQNIQNTPKNEKKNVVTDDKTEASSNTNNEHKFLYKKKYRTDEKPIKNDKSVVKIKKKSIVNQNTSSNRKFKCDVYCKCKKESYGKMIQCENPNCAEWFHYECVGLKEEFDSREKWYCDECRKSCSRDKMIAKFKKKFQKLK